MGPLRSIIFKIFKVFGATPTHKVQYCTNNTRDMFKCLHVSGSDFLLQVTATGEQMNHTVTINVIMEAFHISLKNSYNPNDVTHLLKRDGGNILSYFQ